MTYPIAKKILRRVFFGGRQFEKRDAIVVEWLRTLAPGATLLDAGAGEQRFRPFCRGLRYIAQDFAQYKGGELFAGKVAAWDASKVDVVSDITAIPLPDASVDHILCVEVFEHLPEPCKAVHEFRRLLKPSGSVLITTPFNSQYHQEPYFFYSGFSSYWFQYVADQTGLTISRIVPNGSYYEALAQEVLRLPILKGGTLTLLAALLSFPMILLLKLLDRLRVPSPKAPFGYIVEMRK